MRIKSENELVRELMNRQLVTSNDIDKAYEYQRANKSNLVQALIYLKIIDEDQLLSLVSELMGVEYVRNVSDISISEACLDKVSAKIATRYKIMPISIEKNRLKIGVSNPFNMQTIDDIRTILNYPIDIVIVREADIKQAIDSLYGIGAGTIDVMSSQQVHTIQKISDEEKIDDVTGESSIVKFVNQILCDAHKARATDIHIEPYAHDIKIRYRIDGVLHDIKMPRHLKQYQSSLITRIKIISGLDISEHRLPQDGRIKIATEEGTIDLRISIIPTPFGESVNIRLLPMTIILNIDNLGFAESNRVLIDSVITKTHGIMFLTGPTGSGKTTTLYACLNYINNRDKKIITIEDPIEYQLEGMTQIQIHPKIGLTFSSGLRSMLRHDPDVIMVGEVRDIETAEIAIRSALTGHLVFSTLHTNDAPSANIRLIDMGVEPFLISSGLLCVIAQRLVRVLCPACKKEKVVTANDLAKNGIVAQKDATIYEGIGCQECTGTGYRNRTAIFEVMSVNDTIRMLINKRAAHAELKEAARENGMKTLYEDGWKKVIAGHTSLEEILRVTQEE